MVLFAFIIPIIFSDIVSDNVKSFLYFISLSIKKLLIFMLPFIVFTFIASNVSKLGRNALTFTLSLIIIIFVSNLVAIMLGYGVGSYYVSKLPKMILTVPEEVTILKPMWNVALTPIIQNEVALIAGLILGFFNIYSPNPRITRMLDKMSQISHIALNKVFVTLLPLFLIGFVFKYEHERSLLELLYKFKLMFFVVIGSQLIYLSTLLLIVSKFKIKLFMSYLRNMSASYLTALGTVSSAATMPVTIMNAEQNTRDPQFARMVIPATVNIHTIGSAISFTILSLAVMWAFSMPLPNLSHFIIFAVPYALAKYTVTAVPGGVVVIILPLLVKYMAFTPEMAGILTALYILFDPFGTAANVAGNNIMAIALHHKFKKQEHFKPIQLT